MFVTSDDGVRLNVRIDGPKGAAPLLFLNSIGCDLTLWDAQAAALSAQFRVIRFDARGHGGSGAAEGDTAMERLGRDALGVLDAAGAGQAHVCGLSLGGVVAQWLAINAPDRVDRLILANTAARIGSAEAWQTRRDTVLAQGLTAIADMAMGRFFSPVFSAASPATVARFRAILLATSGPSYAGCCAALRDADFRPDLGWIGAPTLTIAGSLDISTPLAELELLAAAIPDARLTLLDAAHLSNIEQPVAFTDAVRRHLGSSLKQP